MKAYRHFLFIIFGVLFFLVLPLISPAQVFAATDFGTVFSPNLGTTGTDILTSVSAISPANVWAAGSYGGSSSTNSLIEHWNGKVWQQQITPNPGGIANELNGVKALSETDIWAVGYYVYSDPTNPNNILYHSLILHTTDGGTTWSEDTADEENSVILNSVDGDSSTGDAWVVGWTLNSVGGLASSNTLHLVSGNFTEVSNPLSSNSQLYNVSEYSSNDVWAANAGSGGSLHWEYSNTDQKYEWVSKGNPTNINLTNIVDIGTDNAWAIGPSNPYVLSHWNGSSWSSPMNVDFGVVNEMAAITADKSGNIWVGGEYSFSNTNSPNYTLIWRSTDGGSSWQQETTEDNPNSSSNVVRGLTIVPDTSNVWAVGDFSGTTLAEYSAPSTSSLTNSTASDSAVPFLELPFSYTETFNEAALDHISSYFDHEYPLAYNGGGEPSTSASVSGFLDISPQTAINNTVVNFYGARQLSGDTYSGNQVVWYSGHDGIDFALSSGTPVLAAASGSATFVSVAHSGGLGNEIKIDHGNGYETIYGHMQDTGLITNVENNPVQVAAGEQIGLVGMTGHAFGAHLHFGVEKKKNGLFGFTGLTDPFGWEPDKDAKGLERDPDPWENCCSWTSSFTGTESDYLWKHRLDSMLGNYIDHSGGTATLSAYTLNIPSNALPSSVTLTAVLAPFISASVSGIRVKSVLPVFDANVYDLSGNDVTALSNPYIMTVDYNNASLDNIKQSSLSIYSSQDGITWTKESTTLDILNKIATAQIDHFTQFALMGELIDTTAPTTTATLSGTLTSGSNYASDVTVTLSASDGASGSGVQATAYTLDGGDWQQYSAPFTVSGVGSHSAEFYSEDNAGNVEAVNTKNFSIINTYTLSGKVYNDANQNGVQDSGETGYSNATVSLNTGQSTTTDSSGNYSFSSVPAGTYTETLTVPSGYTATTTNPASVSLSSNTTQNFGIASSTVTATAGYTTTNGNYDSGNLGMLSSTQITTGSVSGTSQSISVYIGSIDSSPNNHIQVGIYSDNGSNAPGTLLGESAIQTLTANSWNTITLPDVAIAANTKYFLTFNVDSTITQYAFNSQTTGLSKWKSGVDFGVWPNSFGTPSDSDSLRYSIYLTYANSSGSPTPTPGTVNVGYSTTNGSFDSGNNSQVSSTQVRTGAVSGTSQSISVYVGSVASSPHNHMQVGIYSDNGSDKPGTLLGSSSSQTLTANSWNTISLTGVSISANTKYFLAFNVDGSTTEYGWSNTAAGASRWRNSTYGTWPSSFGTPNYSANQQYAIYLTY